MLVVMSNKIAKYEKNSKYATSDAVMAKTMVYEYLGHMLNVHVTDDNFTTVYKNYKEKYPTRPLVELSDLDNLYLASLSYT